MVTIGNEEARMGKEIELSVYGATLATRDRARTVAFEHSSFAPGDVVVLNFSGVRAASNSFIDELVAQIGEGFGSGRVIEIVGACEPVGRVVERVAARRGELRIVAPA